VNYEYDQYGRKTRTFTGDPADPITDTLYTYDELGRLLTVSVVERNDVMLPTPETTRYEYDLVGNLDETTLPNGVITDYVYDDLNRLISLIHYEGDATPETLSDNQKIVQFDYDLRADGRKNGSTETWYLDEFDTNTDGIVDETEAKEVTTSWTYDEANRLTDEVFTHYDDLLSQTSHFSYDLTGNRLSQEVTKDTDNDGMDDYQKSTTYNYDVNDRLTVEVAYEDTNNDGTIDETTTTTYTYDGTQQSKKSVSKTGVSETTITDFQYDLQGRLEIVTISSLVGVAAPIILNQTTYDYDATGIRVSSLHRVNTDADVNGTFEETTKTEYLNDPHNFTGYSQVIQETEFDENDVITKRTIYTIGHDQISQTTIEYMAGVPQTPQTLFFLADGHASTRVLIDAVGAIANINGKEQVFFFDAYGNLLDQENFQPNQIGTSYLYSGEQFDSRIGQQYLRARYYDATTGRFNRLDDFAGNSRDPQSFHKYLYTHGDPINGKDPLGLWSLSVTLGSMNISINLGAYAATSAVSYLVGKTLNVGYLLYTDGNLNKFQWFEWWDLLNLIPGAAWLKFAKLPLAVVQKFPGKGFVGKFWANEGHKRISQKFAQIFSKGWTRKLSNGNVLRLVPGAKGFRHLIERHLPQYFQGGTEAVLKKTTFWPTGTTSSNVLSYLDEAIKVLDDKIIYDQVNTVTLKNGIKAGLYIAPDGRIASLFPISGPGVIRAIDVLNALK
tara:strand:+ start:261 stop:2441 length:2181 start_codon:yes stop_codon:yes gene_type:complete